MLAKVSGMVEEQILPFVVYNRSMVRTAVHRVEYNPLIGVRA